MAALCKWCEPFGSCMNTDDCEGQQAWLRYWESLTPEECDAELRAMDSYASDPEHRE